MAPIHKPLDVLWTPFNYISKSSNLNHSMEYNIHQYIFIRVKSPENKNHCDFIILEWHGFFWWSLLIVAVREEKTKAREKKLSVLDTEDNNCILNSNNLIFLGVFGLFFVFLFACLVVCLFVCRLFSIIKLLRTSFWWKSKLYNELPWSMQRQNIVCISNHNSTLFRLESH